MIWRKKWEAVPIAQRCPLDSQVTDSRTCLSAIPRYWHHSAFFDHYYITHHEINPTRIVPLGPDQDLGALHGHGHLVLDSPTL